MAHNIIIINGLFKDLIGENPDAAGYLTDLQAKAVSVDSKLLHNLIPQMQRTAAHEALEGLEGWLTDLKSDTQAKQSTLAQWA